MSILIRITCALDTDLFYLIEQSPCNMLLEMMQIREYQGKKLMHRIYRTTYIYSKWN